MYSPDPGSEETPEEARGNYLLVAVALALLLVFAAAFVVLNAPPEKKEAGMKAVPSPKLPSASPSPLPTPFVFYDLRSAPVEDNAVSVTRSIEAGTDFYQDEIVLENTGGEQVDVELLDAIPPELSGGSEVSTSGTGFSSPRLLSSTPFVRSSRAVLAPGQRASQAIRVNHAVANPASAPPMVRVVSPPLDDAQRQVIAPALAEAAEADLAPPASNAVSRAIEDSLAGKGGVSQRTNNAARLANQVMQPVPQLSPPPFFDVQAFFATFPPEIELGVSEANPVASYDLPMYYATPYGIPLLRTDGQLGSYCRVESTQLSNGYYSVVYVDLSNARKNEAGRFEFDSIQGRLAIALPYAGFAEHSIPLTVLVNHLSETEYEQQAFYQDDELFGEEDIEDETVPEDGAVPTEDTAGQQVDENPASETPSSDPSSRIQAASYLATCVNSRIGAMGDSITEAGAREGGYLQRLQGLCQGAVFEGHGISGQGTNRMRERFASDIIARHYDYVIILGGINNIGGPVDRIKTDLQSMYDAAHEAGIRVIAVTVTPWKGWQTGPGGTDWNQERQQKTDELNEWILSRPRNVDVVADAYSALEDPQNQDAMRREYYNADHLHPNAAGHRVLGDAIYAAAFFRAPSQPLVLSRPAPQANAQTPSEQGDWFWPAEGRIGQTQGAPRAGGTRIHLGIDISGQLDSPVYAIQSGRVTKTNTITATAECEARLLACRQGDRTQCPSSSERECSNCGKQVVITEPNGRTHLYCHLNEVMVQVDQEVTPCQQIGKMGHTGNAIAGVHLHYGLFRDGRITTESSSIDPLSVFNPSTSGQSQGQSAARGRETRDLNEAGHCGIAAPRA